MPALFTFHQKCREGDGPIVSYTILYLTVVPAVLWKLWAEKKTSAFVRILGDGLISEGEKSDGKEEGT